MVTLETPLNMCLGKAAARRLNEAGFDLVRDLVYYAPRRYYTWGNLTSIANLREGDEATLLAEVVNANLVKNRSGRGVRLLVNITDGTQVITCIFFAKNPYMLSPHQRLLKPGATVLVFGKVGSYQGRLQMVQPQFEELEDSSPELAARRAGRPIPIYRTIGGLPSWKIGALVKTVMDELAPDSVPDLIPASVRERYSLLDAYQALQDLHFPQTTVDWESARRTLAWEEALTLQTALLASRVDGEGHALRKAPALESGGDSLAVLEKSLPFELTSAQQDAWREISEDLAKDVPMQRLLQADVGAGKTVVALFAMVAAVASGAQAALLAPTEVLARQHFASLARLIDQSGLDIPLHLLTGKRPTAEKTAALSALAEGEPAIVVGTHALIQEGVEIPNLAVLVVDEQHRFGVAQREYLREGRDLTPHLLVMTATPIPRTIAMTVFGDLDVTLMRGMPPGRQPVQTHLVSNQNAAWMERVWQRAREEVEGGGRVYVVCPRIDADSEGEDAPAQLAVDPAPSDMETLWVEDEESPKDSSAGKASPAKGGADMGDGTTTSSVPAAAIVAEELKNHPDLAGVKVGLAHGRRHADDNAATFAAFANGDIPLLVATTVVEVGVDVPEATLMIVLGAQRFGLSQLHQLRGRVGRSSRQSACLLVNAPSDNPITAKRLEAIANTTDGFTLAEVDLRLRSEGDVLGQAQSGHLSGLRFLSVRDDAATIAAARKVAEELLRQDPGLTEHADLAAQVSASVGDDVVWLERN